MYLYKHLKTIKTPILILLALILFSGCQSTPSQDSIYDQDNKLIAVGDSFYFTDRLGSVDENQMELTFKRFYGVQTIWIIESKQDTLTFAIEPNIKSGEFKVILITPDQQIVNLTEISIDGKVEVETELGEYRLKIVGRNAHGTISMSYSHTE